MEPWWDFKKTYRLGETFDEALAEFERVSNRMAQSPDINKQSLLNAGDVINQAQPAIFGGVYFLVNQGVVAYVGRSTNIFYRISQHVERKRIAFNSYHVIAADGLEQERLEQVYIGKLKPEYNIRHVREVL